MTRFEELLANAKAKVEKKQNTITKKEATIEKKQIKLAKATDENERFWLGCDIESLQEDIKRLRKDIKELVEEKIPTYEAKIQAEQDKYAILDEAPAEAIEFMYYLSDTATKEDLNRKYAYKNALEKYWQGSKEIEDKYFKQWREGQTGKRDEEEQEIKELGEALKLKELKNDLIYKEDKEIANANYKKAREIVANFLNEATRIVGKITSTDLIVKLGDINGIIEGEDGRVKINTILAGGWNIQCLHTRVLVKKF